MVIFVNMQTGGANMKKLLLVIVSLAAMATCVFAQEEKKSNKVRIDLLAGDTISTNIFSTTNTTNVGVRFGFKDNNIGLITGVMAREAFLTAEIFDNDWDFYFDFNPYIGIELWNWEIDAGVIPTFSEDDSSIVPYAAVGYNFNLIKPTAENASGLKLKLGVEYFWDIYQNKFGKKPESGEIAPCLGVDLASIIYPKLYIGVQYSFGVLN